MTHWKKDQNVIAQHEDLVWEVVTYERNKKTPRKVEIYRVGRGESIKPWFSLHYSDGIRTAGVQRDGVRYCARCEVCKLNEGNSGGKYNASGYCPASHAHEVYGGSCSAARQRYLTIFDPTYANYRPYTRRCKNCRRVLTQRNTTEYCVSADRPECQKAYRRAQRNFDPTCKHCSREIYYQNIAGYCLRPECQKAYRNSQKFSPDSVCQNCTRTLLKSNTKGYCIGRPECQEAYQNSYRSLRFVLWNLYKDPQYKLSELETDPKPPNQ